MEGMTTNTVIDVTSRYYYRKHEAIEKWRCPSCGAQNDHYDEIDDGICFNCNQKVKIHFRNIRGKKY